MQKVTDFSGFWGNLEPKRNRSEQFLRHFGHIFGVFLFLYGENPMELLRKQKKALNNWNSLLKILQLFET